MGITTPSLTALKGKVPREVEQAFIDLHSRVSGLDNTLQNLKGQIGQLPTAAQLQSHTALVEKALSTYPSFDADIAGVSTGHKQQASILPVVSGAFAYTSNGTSISWFWDGTNGSAILIVNWPDKSITQIPPSNQLVSGLANTTIYNFFPYFDVIRGGIIFAADSVNGTGSPPIAFGPSASILVATAIQSQDNHVPLNLSAMQASTTGGGAGSGSGGGRFGGCVSEDTEVTSLHGELFSFLAPEELWIEIRSMHGRKLRAVPSHRIFSEEGCLRMSHVKPGMRLVTLEGLDPVISTKLIHERGKKRMVWVPQGNLYWANEVLSHNIK